jgi:hypothetical protein
MNRPTIGLAIISDGFVVFLASVPAIGSASWLRSGEPAGPALIALGGTIAAPRAPAGRVKAGYAFAFMLCCMAARVLGDLLPSLHWAKDSVLVLLGASIGFVIGTAGRRDAPTSPEVVAARS